MIVVAPRRVVFKDLCDDHEVRQIHKMYKISNVVSRLLQNFHEDGIGLVVRVPAR